MRHHWRSFITVQLLGLGLALFASVLVTACGESHAESHAAPAATTKAKADPIPVTLTAVVQLPSDAPLRVTGRVSHARDNKPAFKTGGLIKEILVDEGDRVTKGQVLARLDTREIDAGIAQARAAGAIVIDTEPLFRAQLARSPLKLDVGPYDGHLNALGVRIVMQAAADALRAN